MRISILARYRARKNRRAEVMKIAKGPNLVYSDTYTNARVETPLNFNFRNEPRNAERHRATVFVSFIVVLVMGSIWILIRRRGVDESAVSTRRSLP